MDYATLKSAVEKLNESGVMESKIKVVAVKAEDVRANFMKAIGILGLEKTLTLDKSIIMAFVYTAGALTDAQYAELPELTRAVYDGLPEEYFSQPDPSLAAAPAVDGAAAPAEGAPAAEAAAAPAAPAEPKAPKAPKPPKKPGDKGYKSECADFGKKCDDTSTLCQTCKTNKNEEYVVCVEKTAAKANKKAPTAPVREKNSLGHVIGSMSASIDEILLAGPAYADDIVKKLMEKHGKEATKAKEKLKSHVSWLVNREGHKVDQVVEGEGEAKRTKLTLTAKSA